MPIVVTACTLWSIWADSDWGDELRLGNLCDKSGRTGRDHRGWCLGFPHKPHEREGGKQQDCRFLPKVQGRPKLLEQGVHCWASAHLRMVGAIPWRDLLSLGCIWWEKKTKHALYMMTATHGRFMQLKSWTWVQLMASGRPWTRERGLLNSVTCRCSTIFSSGIWWVEK